jgi:hypothetical protein
MLVALSPHSEMLTLASVFARSQTRPLGFASILLLNKSSLIRLNIFAQGMNNRVQIAADRLLAVFVHFLSKLFHFLLDVFFQFQLIHFILIVMGFQPQTSFFSVCVPCSASFSFFSKKWNGARTTDIPS